MGKSKKDGKGGNETRLEPVVVQEVETIRFVCFSHHDTVLSLRNVVIWGDQNR